MAVRKRGDRFQNRELSWLAFNERILDLACDKGTPLLERVRFLAISSSNLDEFCMVRVGGLQTLVAQGVARRDAAGMTPAQQLAAVGARTQAMVGRQAECYAVLEAELGAAKIRRVRPEALTEEQRAHCAEVFEREVFPVVSPIAYGGKQPDSLLSNRMLYVVVRLKGEGPEGGARLAMLPLGRPLGRLITLPSRGGYEFILIEDLVGMFAERFVPGEAIAEWAALRITRNADMGVREDLAADLLAEMEAVLEQRKRSECVRLELDAGARKTLEATLVRLLGVLPDSVYRTPAPIDLSALSALCDLKGFGTLLNEPWAPQLAAEVASEPDLFSLIAHRDILLYHPFESFEPFVRFIQQAAADPDVVAIKQVLYRTSRSSPITVALMQAAQSGKYVTVIIELKARFDEARNIEWAQELEDAGVQVVYGVKGLKTHAKICVVVRREGSGLRRYMHFGTGNYNEQTARLYTDVSFMTADTDLGADASAFFNAMTGFSQPHRYLKLEAAPIGLRDRVIELIEAETERRKQGQESWIRAKMNSLADRRTIEALYEASQAGVNIELNIRGICCLRPGIPGLSENIRVVSIIDRFLEHSRILSFCNGGQCRVFISSADWMPRNFDKRVELLVPVEEPRCRERLLGILAACCADTANAWELRSDGVYERLRPVGKKSRVRSQEELYRQAVDAWESARKARPTMFEPHRPQGTGP